MRRAVGVQRFIAGLVRGWICWAVLYGAGPAWADISSSPASEGGQNMDAPAEGGNKPSQDDAAPKTALPHIAAESGKTEGASQGEGGSSNVSGVLAGVMGLVEGGNAEQKLQERLRILSSARQALEARERVLHETMSAFSEHIDNRKIVPQEAVERLVGIYEAMNPKEAAAVFDVMDPHVLIALSAGMNIRKLSAIMAHMTPDRVNLVSQYLVGVRHFHNLGEGVSPFLVSGTPGPEGGGAAASAVGKTKPLAVIQYKPMTKNEPLLPSRQ